jgi:hypothetical protein
MTGRLCPNATGIITMTMAEANTDRNRCDLRITGTIRTDGEMLPAILRATMALLRTMSCIARRRQAAAHAIEKHYRSAVDEVGTEENLSLR